MVGQAASVATPAEIPENLGDGEGHVGPNDLNTTADGDVHIFAKTRREGG